MPKNVVLANEGAFRKLPADVQKAMLDAAQSAEARGWKMSEEQNVEAPKMLAENGLKVEPMTPQLRGELKRSARPCWRNGSTRRRTRGEK